MKIVGIIFGFIIVAWVSYQWGYAAGITAERKQPNEEGSNL